MLLAGSVAWEGRFAFSAWCLSKLYGRGFPGLTSFREHFRRIRTSVVLIKCPSYPQPMPLSGALFSQSHPFYAHRMKFPLPPEKVREIIFSE